MGYMRHHTIIVIGFSAEYAAEAHTEALRVFDVCPVSNVIESDTNGYWSFLVGPDGSKEGWDTSDQGDNERAEFIRWMKKARDRLYLDWAVTVWPEDGFPQVDETSRGTESENVW